MSDAFARRARLLSFAFGLLACADAADPSPEPDAGRDASIDAAPEVMDATNVAEPEQEPQAPVGKTEEHAGPAKFYTEPVAEGYQRFEPPAIEVDPGESYDWAQWVGGPLDQDYDVVDINGAQSVGGHHALVYATTVAQRPGTTRLWQEEDQLTSRLMGGIGGEGGANVRLPKGVVFRVKKGSYLLIQTHYLNATDKPILGRTVMDIKLEPVDASRTVASMVSITSLGVRLPAHAESSLEVSCKIERDLRFLMVSNHMHDWGTIQTTSYVDPSGESHTIVDDQSWTGELALNPTWTKYTLDKPGLVPKGSVITTRCTWNNTTDNEITFPTEMCVFFGFVVNENDIYCHEGKWSEAKTFGSAPEEATAPASTPEAPDEMMTDPGTMTDVDAGVETEDGPEPAAYGCTSMSDQTIMGSAEFDAKSTQCATPCGLDPDVAACTAPCFEEDIGLSPACAACNAKNIACGSEKCLRPCLTNSASAACRSCVMESCDAAFRECTGT